MMEHILIGGLGYTGKAIYRNLKASGRQVSAFSSNTQYGESMRMDANHEGSADQLGRMIESLGISHLILTFPPQGLSADFLQVATGSCACLLLGTTSVYPESGIITEMSRVDKAHNRIGIEEAFIKLGGQVMRLSGIYGPGRDPLDWIQRGNAKRYAETQLNLIHLENIVEFLLHWIGERFSGAVMNLSDGQRHTWGEIYSLGGLKGIKCPELLPGLGPEGSRVISNQFARTAYPSIHYVDFFEQYSALNFGKSEKG
jgi:nucleoside-diphosphate-sugar epimerase